MISDLIKLKVNRDTVIDIDIQNEIIRLKDRMNNLETSFNPRFNIIEFPINELLKTILNTRKKKKRIKKMRKSVGIKTQSKICSRMRPQKSQCLMIM